MVCSDVMWVAIGYEYHVFIKHMLELNSHVMLVTDFVSSGSQEFDDTILKLLKIMIRDQTSANL